MKNKYISPDMDIVVLKLVDVILNSLDESVLPTGNIEDPDEDMLEP